MRASGTILGTSFALSVFTGFSLVAAGEGDTPSGRWEFFDTPHSGFSDLVIEPGNVVWIISGKKVYYLAGDQFREPVWIDKPPHGGPGCFYGSPETAAYVSWLGRGNTASEGDLYQIVDGEARRIAAFHIDVGSYDRKDMPPDVYVSKSGTIFNWGNRFLARHDGNQWTRIEAILHKQNTRIFDRGEEVYFYHENRLYRSGSEGIIDDLEPPTWDVARDPTQNWRGGALWGDRNALLFHRGLPGLFAFDLLTLQPISLDLVNREFADVYFIEAFSVSDGSVWLLGGRPPNPASLSGTTLSYFRLEPDGTLEEQPETADLAQYWRPPSKVLFQDIDGSIWFNPWQRGLAVYSDGRMVKFGWQDGLTSRVDHVREDTAGNIWCGPVDGKLAVFRKGGTPAPMPSHLAIWDAYPIQGGGSRVWQTRSGDLLMFRPDRPGKLCRWDGREWAFFNCPADVKSIRGSLLDDQDRLLLEIGPTWYQASWMLVEPDGSVRNFKDVRDAVLMAVTEGANEFDWDPRVLSCAVTNDGAILLHQREHGQKEEVLYFDGKSWSTLDPERAWYDRFPVSSDFPLGGAGLIRSIREGNIFRSRSGGFFACRDGELSVVFPEPYFRLMVGPQGFQPYEREMVEAHPGHYWPVRGNNNPFSLMTDVDGFEALSQQERETADRRYELYSGVRLIPSKTVGSWLFPPLGRLVGRDRLGLSFSETPVEGQHLLDVKEDRAGNVWFVCLSGQAYICKASELHLRVDGIPTECTREWRPQIFVSPDIGMDRVRICWRVSEGPWTAGERGEVPVVRLLRSGDVRCDFALMHACGAVAPVFHSSEVRAGVDFPETELTGSDFLNLKEPLWFPPVQPVPSRLQGTVELAWRIGARDWEVLSPGSPLVMPELEPGMYEVQFAGLEEGLWYDPTPVTIQLIYSPDYGRFFRRRFDDILSEDQEASRKAIEEIKLFGATAIRMLEWEIKRAERAKQSEQVLRELLKRLKAKFPEYPRAQLKAESDGD